MFVSTRTTNILLVLILAVGIGIVAMLASGVRGGPLDPPKPVAPSMKTLDDIPPAWDQTLAFNDNLDVCLSSRFKCVLNNAGIYDRETGLVWQLAPPTGVEGWLQAINDCHRVGLGGHYGWRLPRVEEFYSLLESNGFLPIGVFINVQTGNYWTTTDDPISVDFVEVMRFDFAPPNSEYVSNKRLDSEHVWCVRGGAGEFTSAP